MVRARFLLVTTAALGCGPAMLGGHPDVRGTFNGQLESTLTLADGQKLTGVPCLVTIVIDTEESGVLGGSFTRGGGACLRAQSVLAGTVDRDGALTLDLTGPRGFQDFDGCTYLEGARTWSGHITASELTARIDPVLDCAGAGRVQAAYTVHALVARSS